MGIYKGIIIKSANNDVAASEILQSVVRNSHSRTIQTQFAAALSLMTLLVSTTGSATPPDVVAFVTMCLTSTATAYEDRS